LKGHEKQAIVYTAACHGMVHILELSYGVVLVSIAQEFGASLFVLGVLANILGFTYGAMALPVGFLADRMSERRLLVFCCLGMGIASIAIGLSPNIYALGGFLAVLGLALGIYHPAASAFISRAVAKRGLAFGYLGVGGNIGVAIGPLLAGIIASFMGWRWAYFIFAIPAFSLAAMLFFSARGEANFVQQPVNDVSTEKPSLRPFILPLAAIFFIQIMAGFIYRGVLTFLPLYLSQHIHLPLFDVDSALIAGSFTTIALVFGIGGQFLSGHLMERKRHENLVFITFLVVVPSLLLMGESEGLVLMTAASAFAFFYFMGQPILNCLVADYSPAEWRGRIYGAYFFSNFTIGSFSATMLGYIAEKFGTNWIFIVAAGFALLALIGTVFLMVRAWNASKKDKGDLCRSTSG
jgi:MFS family permease